MLPMVRTLWEAKAVLQIMKEEGLERNRDFKVWFMAETPSIGIMADEFSKLVDACLWPGDLVIGLVAARQTVVRVGGRITS